MKQIIRTIHPVIRVVDAAKGIVEYVASDETLDSYREVIRADGWRFDRFRKNSPFVDSHDYSTIDKLVGSVVDFKVVGKQLVETVQWAIDVAGNRLAQLGFAMTQAGHLKAVSVGFIPEQVVSRFGPDTSAHARACADLGMKPEQCDAVYLRQQQIELSACIIGANPSALAKSYKAGILNDEDLDMFSIEATKREHGSQAHDPADACLSRQRARTAFLMDLYGRINRL
jgi:hypothetical protein